MRTVLHIMNFSDNGSSSKRGVVKSVSRRFETESSPCWSVEEHSVFTYCLLAVLFGHCGSFTDIVRRLPVLITAPLLLKLFFYVSNNCSPHSICWLLGKGNRCFYIHEFSAFNFYAIVWQKENVVLNIVYWYCVVNRCGFTQIAYRFVLHINVANHTYFKAYVVLVIHTDLQCRFSFITCLSSSLMMSELIYIHAENKMTKTPSRCR